MGCCDGTGEIGFEGLFTIPPGNDDRVDKAEELIEWGTGCVAGCPKESDTFAANWWGYSELLITEVAGVGDGNCAWVDCGCGGKS